MGSLIELGVTGFEGRRDLGVEGDGGIMGTGWLMLRDIEGEWFCAVILSDIGAIDWRCGGGGGGGRDTMRALDVDRDRGNGGRTGGCTWGTAAPENKEICD